MAYKVGYIYLPDTEGFSFSYDPKIVTRTCKRTGIAREKKIWQNSYCCKTKKEAEAKKAELEAHGIECDKIYECIY